MEGIQQYVSAVRVAFGAGWRAALAFALTFAAAKLAAAGADLSLATDISWWQGAAGALVAGAVNALARAALPELTDQLGIGVQPTSTGRLGLLGRKVAAPRE